MVEPKGLSSQLKEFIKILKLEKKALIENNGELVNQIVNKKQEFVSFFSSIQPSDMSKEQLKWLIQIQELQATNLILTKQALSYQNNLVEAIAKTAKKNGSTYSKKGYVKVEEDLSLVDHSV